VEFYPGKNFGIEPIKQPRC